MVFERVIRPYDPETDFPAVEAILKEAELYDRDRDTRERLAQYAGDIIVAEYDSEVVGSVYVVPHIVSSIWRLCVAERRRGIGLGTNLLNAAIEHAKKSGSVDVELFFDSSDRHLARWYKARGFTDGGKYRSAWKYTQEGLSDVMS